METFYHHNPTSEEVAGIGRRNIEGLSQDTHYGLISDLYALRKDKAKAVEYAEKISEEAVRRDRLYLLAESPNLF